MRCARQTPASRWQKFAGKWVLAKLPITTGTAAADRKKYAGLGVTELRKLRQLEEENQKLKQLVAEWPATAVEPGHANVTGYTQKKALRPVQKRTLAASLMKNYQVAVLRACSVVCFQRSCWYYKPHRREDSAIPHRIREIAQVRILYGYQRIHVLLRREGWRDNHIRVYRVYNEEGRLPSPRD